MPGRLYRCHQNAPEVLLHSSEVLCLEGCPQEIRCTNQKTHFSFKVFQNLQGITKVFAEQADCPLQDVPHLHHDLLGLEHHPGPPPLLGWGQYRPEGNGMR